MIKNYLKIALRNLKKYKGYSLINILGLALGMACFFIIMMYVNYELSFDKYHQKKDRIFRIAEEKWTGSPFLLGESLKKELPEIEDLVRFRMISNKLLDNKFMKFKTDQKNIYERGVLAADPSILNIFSYQFIHGQPETAMNNQHSMVITESFAKKIFGDENPLGKNVVYDDKINLTVGGVIKDVPDNSHFSFNVIIPLSVFNYSDTKANTWGSGNYKTYILTKNNTDSALLKGKIEQVYSRDSGEPQKIILQPLTDIHLKSHIRGEIGENRDISTIYFYVLIGLVILIIACINFINQATAHSLNRIREVSVRKVIGAVKGQLVKQFLGESVLVSFLTLPVALILTKILTPYFNNIAGTDLNIHNHLSIIFLLLIVGIIALIGIISGSYPALFVSKFDPVKGLKGESATGKSRFSVRNFLTILQFTISIILICVTLIINSQMNFISTQDLGFKPDQVIYLNINQPIADKYQIIKNDLLKNPRISGVTYSNFLLSHSGTFMQGVEWEGQAEGADESLRWISVDHDFIKTFGITLKEGRDFSKSFPDDVGYSYILNESAVKYIGWQESAVGKKFKIERGKVGMGKVIGVMKDFYYRTLHHQLEPVVFCVTNNKPQGVNFWDVNLFIKISTRDIPEVLGAIKGVFNKHIPGLPFESNFFNEDFARAYKNELKSKKIFNAFSTIAIFLACMGLLGLSALLIEKKTKEIGVRKILGASISSLIILFSKGFIKVLILANIIAVPIVYFFMSNWLENFAYKISINPQYFLVTALFTGLIAFFTIGSVTIKAALKNPIDTLRDE